MKVERDRLGLFRITALLVLASCARSATAATIGEAHVMVFKQGSSTTRSVGSLIGVWHWTGRTFANQHQNVWMRTRELAPDANSDLFGVKILRTDPRYAFASGERGMARWTGTTWIETQLQANTGNVIHPIGIATSDFAVVGNPSQQLWRWSGTSWLHEIDGGAGLGAFRTLSVLSTNYAYAFLDPPTGSIERAVLHWRGTTWRSHLNHGGSSGVGGMTATNYGWYVVDPDSGTAGAFQWTGTSWRLHSTLGPMDARAGEMTTFLAIPGENDFAVVAGGAGEIWRWTGTSWLDETGITTQSIQGGDAYATNFAFLIGNSGTLLRWTGTSWVIPGPITSNVLAGVSIARTDYALLAGLSGTTYLWRGTSWVAEPGTEIGTLRMLASDTVGESLSMLAGDKLMLLTKQRVNLIDDATGSGGDWTGTLYRTVVQATPRGADWNWDSDSSQESYFGVINHSGNTYQFLDEGDSDTAGRQLVINRALGDTSIEDCFIWEDTVGNWDGHSENPHNGSGNESSGINLVQGGDVLDSVGSDVWGETDYKIDGGGNTTWAAAVGNTIVANGKDLVWEFWHYMDAGFSQGDLIDTGIRVKNNIISASQALQGIRWEYRVGRYTPRTGNWRWCKDDAAEPTIVKEPGGRLTDVSPNGERLRLRVRIDETNGGWMASATGDSGWTLWFSDDQVNWDQMTTASSEWFLYNGQGSSGSAVSGASLPGVDTLGIQVERNSAQNGFLQEPFTEVEMDFAIQSTAAATGTIYYFEARNNGHRALPKPGVAYPSVRTTDDTTHNYVYTRPELGRFSRPMVNPAVAAGGNGDPFKVVYVATQGGSGDQLFAISRTNGGLVRSFSASGTLEHGNLYWDSTNSRYNLFFRQGNSSVLALADNGGTIVTHPTWDLAQNPVNMTNLIGRPVRVFDGDRQNYLMLLVTSFQGNTSTLYRLRGSDGTVMTDGEYSKALPSGWAGGLRVVGNMYPLWVEGTTFALATAAGQGVVKLPNGPGATPTTLPESDGGTSGFNTSQAFGPTYTRTTITTGGRILFSQNALTQNGIGSVNLETALRINDADMTGVEWANGVTQGASADLCDSNNFQSSPFSPPFQSAFPVPVYIGDTAQVNRLSGSTGVNENNYPFNLTGSVNTEIMIKGNWIYFGTDEGYIYALSATDPTGAGGANAFRVPSGSSVVGVAIDSTNSLIYYTTQDGRIYQFDTR